ncbi:hypothetical protein AMS68_007463 [Peltaster fructicola]|uniref:Protein BFR2 n=1 Tax=Peltaster fructicola TaxID=286661 RepID=A0A6H0Y4Q3_9PEZI|nr:hypothetical protein AMS68_007463 [Peltaster fructicola]
MAGAKGRDRSRDFDVLANTVAQDFDPEIDAPSSSDESDQDLHDDADAKDGREHYVAAAKSKLRKPKEISLGPQYRGSKISRDAVLDDNDDEDDPFSKNFDEEDSEEEEEAPDGLEDASGDSDDDGYEMDDSADETDDTEVSEARVEPAIDRSELRKSMAAEQTAVSAMITAANKADAEKGRAVLQQRATFDALLNTRIKMQKSLIATNSLVALNTAQLDALRASQIDVIEQAETAANHLWTTLTTFRDQLNAVKTGEKRKAPASTSLGRLMKHLRMQEESVTAQRNAVLQKWSMKSRGVTATPQRGRLNNEQPATIVDVLNEHMSSSERLLKRARTPRSCAPVQLANRISEDEHIYDDADFYGLLLKELLEAKSSAASAAATNVDLSNLSSMRREAKTRKNVDTKASKGRKLRYTVHEKLQNYCAPEDRTTWGERQVDELFTSLFGQNAGLNEDQYTGRDGHMEEDEDANLIMFNP